MPPERTELGQIEQKVADFIKTRTRPLRVGLALSTLFGGTSIIAACSSPHDKITPVPPIIETRKLPDPPQIPDVNQHYEAHPVTSEQLLDLIGSLAQFVNVEYLQRGISLHRAEFDPEISRTFALVRAGSQPFFIMNHYERGVENGRLLSAAVYPDQNMGRSEINFDSVPGRPYSRSDFNPTPENLKILLSAIYNLPPMEWEETTWKYVNPPIHNDILRGSGEDSSGRSIHIEAITNREDEMFALLGERGLGGLHFVSFWVNYQ